VSLLTRPDLRGVVGFIGEMESGKTTAAASSVRGRLLALGGIAVAIEDPPETNLDGEHGDGRCISVEVGAGGYKAATKKAMRTGASIIYLGEVRDEDPAAEVAMGGNNGHLIFTTWHAGSIEDGVKRIAAMCGKTISNPENLLSTGLAALIHLRLEDHTINTMKGKKVTKVLRYNFLEIKDHIETQNIIRNGNFHKLQDAMETQKANRRASSI
jgi:Tfp pilus assembly ATPase PilU